MMIKIKLILGGGLFGQLLFLFFCGTCSDTEHVWAHAGRVWSARLGWAVHAQHSVLWGRRKSHQLAHYVSQQPFGKARGSVCHGKALLSPSYAQVSPSQCTGKFPKHHLGTTGGVTVSLGSEVMWWGRSFHVPTTEILYFISDNLLMGFPFNNLSFPPVHVPKWRSRRKNAKLKPIAQNMKNASVRAWVWSASVAVSTLFYLCAFDHRSVAGWCQWVVALNAAALLAKGKLLSCLSCLNIWGEQGQTHIWYGDNDLNMSEMDSVKPEIQTLFISLC